MKLSIVPKTQTNIVVKKKGFAFCIQVKSPLLTFEPLFENQFLRTSVPTTRVHPRPNGKSLEITRPIGWLLKTRGYSNIKLELSSGLLHDIMIVKINFASCALVVCYFVIYLLCFLTYSQIHRKTD